MLRKLVLISVITSFLIRVRGEPLECLDVDFSDLEPSLLGPCASQPSSVQFTLTTVEDVLAGVDDPDGALAAVGPGFFCNDITVDLMMDQQSVLKMALYFEKVSAASTVSLLFIIDDEVYVDNTLSEFEMWNNLVLPLNLDDEYVPVTVRLLADLKGDDTFLLKYMQLLRTDSEAEECINLPPLTTTTPITTTTLIPTTTTTTQPTTTTTTTTVKPPEEPQPPAEVANNETLWMILAIVFIALFLIISAVLGIVVFYLKRPWLIKTKSEDREPIFSVAVPKIPRLYVKNEINSSVITGVPIKSFEHA